MNQRSYNTPPVYVEDDAFLAGEKTLYATAPILQTSPSMMAPSSKSKDASPPQSGPNFETYVTATATENSVSSSGRITSYPESQSYAILTGQPPTDSPPPSKSLLPESAEERKNVPVVTGVLDYFPRAIAEVAKVSREGNRQHFPPGTPLHWREDLSADHADALVRHLMQRGTRDKDRMRHTAKVAWRALALLETELKHENTD